jgi:hypothetical protein
MDASFFMHHHLRLMILTGAVGQHPANNRVEAKQLFFTASGRIGTVSIVNDTQLALHLTALQRNLAHVVQEAGGLDHGTCVHSWPKVLDDMLT